MIIPQSGMFNFTPPHWRNVPFLLLFTCTLSACTCGSSKKESKASTADAPHPVNISKSLFYNGDSLRYYAALAYKDEDPKALFVTAAASIISGQDPDFPDSIYTVQIDEAEIMLLRSAELGYEDALNLIHCLDAQGCWHHSIPETLNDK